MLKFKIILNVLRIKDKDILLFVFNFVEKLS